MTFGRVLREAGLEVGPGRVIDALHGLDAVELERRDDVYWALRQTLVSRCRGSRGVRPRVRGVVPARARAGAPADAEDWIGAGSRRRTRGTAPTRLPRPAPRTRSAPPGWSAEELLRHKDFSELSPEELTKLRRLIAELARARPLRRSRRLRRHPRGDTLDMRRLVRKSLATGGDPVDRAFRSRLETHRKLIVLCDVSGSMEPYSRAILLFVHGLLESGRGVEAFAFGTRLTRLTEELSGPDPEKALEETSRRVVDWSGGTRIGASLKAFNDLWGRRALSRGAVVVVVSDGWEREDTVTVAREMARLARCAYAVVWVNPLKGHPDYEPLAGGMRAALPFVDRFLPGHNLASLEDLAGVLAGIERRHAA